MKNRSFARVPYYLFRQRNPLKDPQTVLELAIPHAKPERSQDLFEKILRWEEDGGRVVKSNYATPEKFPVQPVHPISRL